MDVCRSESQLKRSCYRGHGFEAHAHHIQLSAPTAMDQLLETLLQNSDSQVLAESLERLLDKQASDRDKNIFLEKSLDFGCRLQEAANKLTRQRATHHNYIVWPLTYDLTVKVFSLLGTQSLCYAAATCTMFYKLSVDPACYADVDLTTRGVSNMTVLKMVQRAGQCFRSLRLGILPQRSKKSTGSLTFFDYNVDITPKSADSLDKSWQYRHSNHDKKLFCLTRSCLDTLSLENGASGSLLKTLHLYNIDEMDNKALCKALSFCPSLADLEVVGLHVQLRSLLNCLSSHCHHLERLCCQSSKTGRTEALKSRTCVQLVKGCPNLSSLALRGFKLNDQKVNVLLKGFRYLKLVDFSTSPVTGTFLRTLTDGGNEPPLEILILRDSARLKEVEVEKFLFALSAGECKCLRYLDISNKDGLAAANWFERYRNPCGEGIARLQSERPQLHLVAEFLTERSESESMISSFDDSDDSGALRISLQSSDISTSEFSSDSSYSSNTSSDDDEIGSNAWNPAYQEFIL